MRATISDNVNTKERKSAMCYWKRKSRLREMVHAQWKIKKSLLAQEARCEEGIQHSSEHLHFKIIWRKKLKDLKRKRRATDVRLERVCKSDCLNLPNKENISKLKFLEIVKIVKNHQEPHFAHVLIVVIFIFHETLLLAYVKKI